MSRYVALRIAQALLVLWLTFTLVFLAVIALPSDPVTIYLANDASADPETIARLREFYGYDRPWYEQYVVQLTNLLGGDLGYSISSGQRVTERIGGVVGQTVQLASTALLVSALIAVLVAAGAYLVKIRWVRGLIVTVPPLFSAIPPFWLGLAVVQLLSFQLGVLSLFPDGSLLSLLVPATVLAVPVSAPIAQVLLKNVESAADLAFVQTARAKGATPSRVFFSHVLRASLAPAFTIAGTTLGILVAGSVITETVFSRSGLGSVLLGAVVAQDIPLVQGLVFLTTCVVVLATLVVDLSYPVLDPRVLRGRRSPGVVRLGA